MTTVPFVLFDLFWRETASTSLLWCIYPVVVTFAVDNNRGKSRDSRGFSVVKQAQTIAVLSSMEDQVATPILSQVGSVEMDAM